MIRRMLTATVILCLSLSTDAKGEESLPASDCQIPTTFFAYKDAKKAQYEGDIKSAFNIFCSLALQGDDRAQYQLARFYAKKIESHVEKDLFQAYAWASLANKAIPTSRKSKLRDEITTMLNSDEHEAAIELYAEFRSVVGSGRRIDQLYKKLDLIKIHSKYKENLRKQRHVGTHIRGKGPAAFADNNPEK